MKLFQVVAESIGEVGFGVIKNSGRGIYGGGQAIVGMVTENDELVENGVKNLGHGAFGLSIGLVQKVIETIGSKTSPFKAKSFWSGA